MQVIIPIYGHTVSYFSHKTFLIAMRTKTKDQRIVKKMSEHLQIQHLTSNDTTVNFQGQPQQDIQYFA